MGDAPWTPKQLSPEFWHTIHEARRSRDGLCPLLHEMTRDQLYEFYRQYEEVHTALLDPEYFKPGVSEDDVADIAMWVIAQGEATYRDIHDHPCKMPSELPTEEGLGFTIWLLGSSRSGSAKTCLMCSTDRRRGDGIVPAARRRDSHDRRDATRREPSRHFVVG